jgi:arylsulfatase A-like enzyme
MENLMKNKITLAVSTFVFCLMSVGAQQPNIVHILVDDLGWQDVACYYKQIHGKDSLYETPNIDKAAENGIRFMQAYSPAPTCAPSRAAYLTGHFGVKNGVWHVKGSRIPRAWGDKPEITPHYSARITPAQTIIPDVLKKAGYYTAHVGKWHVCGENMVPTPLQMGFDFSYGDGHKYNDPEIVDPNDRNINNKEGIYDMPKPTRLDAFDDPRFPLDEDGRPYDSLTDIAIRFLDKAGRKDQPFFLNFCPKLVHGPIMTRDRKRLEHYCKKIGLAFPKDPGSIADPEAPGQNNPYYASMIDSVDWMVGQVVEVLETLDDPRNPGHKLIDNTYVIIASDNGHAQRLATWTGLDGKRRFEKVTDGSPLRGSKTWSYEGGVRIPFIVMGPDINAGTVNSTTPVTLLDLFPTFMAIGGMKADRSLGLDGCNILPVLKGETQEARQADGAVRDTLMWHHPMDDKAFSVIRKGPWKLMKNTAPHWTDAPELQLYRMVNSDGTLGDIGEQNNLVEQHPEVTRQLLAELADWMEEHDARVPNLNPNAKPPLPGHQDIPLITGRGSKDAQLWATFETQADVPVTRAFLMYSLNGGTELKVRAPRLEEWIHAPAILKDGRVEAVAPPGMTHAVFCLVDANNFLVYSEPVPAVGGQCNMNGPVSTFLKDGYAYRPGLYSLIQVGDAARMNLEKKGANTDELVRALKVARQTVDQPVEEKTYAPAIRDLRHAIRAFDGQVPEASLSELNWIQLGTW